LKRAAGDRSMGDEIRRRLDASFVAESAHPQTRELLEAIAFVIRETDSHYGNWSEDPFSFEVLKACLDSLLTACRPKGEAVRKTDPNPNIDPNASGFSNLYYDPAYSVKDLGRLIAGQWLYARANRR
jgi:hypothetical protein